MIEVLNKRFYPNLFIEFSVGDDFKNHPVLFVWEDEKISQNINIDNLEINSGINYFSTIQRSISDFSSNVKFSIICKDTHEVLFSENFINTSFISGNNILYISQNSYTGYGYAARNYIHQLLQNGYNVQWELIDDDINNNYTFTRKEEFFVKKCLYNKLDKIDTVILHHTPEVYPKYVKKYNQFCVTGLTTWEFDTLPHEWIKYINILNNLIVPSNFNKHTFEKCGIKVPINVWSHDIFDFIESDDYNKSKFFDEKCNVMCGGFADIDYILKNYVVYYNISEFTPRKNLEQMIHCFLKKFKSKDGCCLFLKTSLSFKNGNVDYLKSKIKSIINQYQDVPPIICCFADDLSDLDIQFIHEFGDVYFTLNRGEGFGLTTYTAKKIGNRIICGKYGAESEFLDENEDILIDYKMERNYKKVQSPCYINMEIPIYKNEDVINSIGGLHKSKKKKYIK